jgi:hypothetical protein
MTVGGWRVEGPSNGEHTGGRDPGWIRAATGLAPVFATVNLRRLNDGLLVLRSLFLTYLAGSGWLAATAWLASRHPLTRHHSDRTDVVVVLAGCAVLLAVVAVVRSRPAPVEDAAAAARRYRTRFLVGMSVAETAAVVGLAAVWASGHVGFYAVGWASALVGFRLVAPTARDVEERQDQLARAGFRGDLRDALRRPFL